MDLYKWTDGAITELHDRIHSCLKEDDICQRAGKAKPYEVRENADWSSWAAELENEMQRRGLVYRPLNLSAQPTVRFFNLPNDPTRQAVIVTYQNGANGVIITGNLHEGNVQIPVKDESREESHFIRQCQATIADEHRSAGRKPVIA